MKDEAEKETSDGKGQSHCLGTGWSGRASLTGRALHWSGVPKAAMEGPGGKHGVQNRVGNAPFSYSEMNIFSTF